MSDFNENNILQHFVMYVILIELCLFLASELAKKLARILGNARFSLNLAAVCLVLFLVGGFLAFTPKYLETQFFIPAWHANAVMGTEIIASFNTRN